MRHLFTIATRHPFTYRGLAEYNRYGMPKSPVPTSPYRINRNIKLRAASKMTRNPYIFGAFGAFLLLWFAIYNGYPVVYEDSAGYFQRPATQLAQIGIVSEWTSEPKKSGVNSAEQDKGRRDGAAGDNSWMAGRSVYYGIFNSILAAIGTSWLIVAVQCYVVAATIAVIWTRCGFSTVYYFPTIAFLCVATGLSVFSVTLLPDILMGVSILALAATLAIFSTLLRKDIAFLTLVMAYGALSHDSNLLALVLALVAAAVVMALLPTLRQWKKLAPLAAACCIGVAGNLLFWATAVAATGEAPRRLPHLTAKLATSNEGRRFLNKACPDTGFHVCAFAPAANSGNWIDFLFSHSADKGAYAIADSATKRALADEQLRFAAAMLADDPPAVMALQFRSIAEQLTRFSLSDLDTSAKRNFIDTKMTQNVRDKVRATKGYSGAPIFAVISYASYVSVIAAMVALALLWMVRFRKRRAASIDALAALLGAGIILNAVICALIAGAYDRFQARVVWVLPLAAILLVLSHVTKYGNYLRIDRCKGA
jgi:hypothetical protein